MPSLSDENAMFYLKNSRNNLEFEVSINELNKKIKNTYLLNKLWSTKLLTKHINPDNHQKKLNFLFDIIKYLN